MYEPRPESTVPTAPVASPEPHEITHTADATELSADEVSLANALSNTIIVG